MRRSIKPCNSSNTSLSSYIENFKRELKDNPLADKSRIENSPLARFVYNQLAERTPELKTTPIDPCEQANAMKETLQKQLTEHEKTKPSEDVDLYYVQYLDGNTGHITYKNQQDLNNSLTDKFIKLDPWKKYDEKSDRIQSQIAGIDDVITAISSQSSHGAARYDTNLNNIPSTIVSKAVNSFTSAATGKEVPPAFKKPTGSAK